MLSRAQKLSVAQFDAIMEKGRVAHSPLFLVQYTVENLDTRVAAVAPKKIARTAVIRNSMKRKIYEAARPLYTSLISGLHVAILAKSGIKDADKAAITEELKNVFVKARLLR